VIRSESIGFSGIQFRLVVEDLNNVAGADHLGAGAGSPERRRAHGDGAGSALCLEISGRNHIVFQALGRIWRASGRDEPRLLTGAEVWAGKVMEFTPNWSADGASVFFVSWDDQKVGHVLRIKTLIRVWSDR